MGKALEPGACYQGDAYNGGKFISCGYSEADCYAPADNYLWTWFDDKDWCDSNDMPVGRCIEEDYCEVNTDPSNFKRSDEDEMMCTNQRDKSKPWDPDDPSFTQFGSCRNTVSGEYFCIYFPSDCDHSGYEVYATPAETLAAGVVCDCSKVHVSACQSGRYEYCSLNGDSCPETYVIKSPHQLRIEDREYPSRLCRYKNTAPPTVAPTTVLKPTKTPITPMFFI